MENLISEHDKAFTSKLWNALHKLTGSSSRWQHHPETDGSSERTNKTMVQAICYHVDRKKLVDAFENVQ
jgi:hypothetical protein